MTAFNTSQLDEEHQDGAEDQIRESSSDSLSPSGFDSVSSKKSRPYVYRCCCKKESSRGADEKDESSDTSSRFSRVCCHHALNSDKLSENFMSKQEVLCVLNHELEQERIAAESAANEAISMILRLQVEKAALQMEARHYQELFEARTLYNEETISQLKDVISNQEADRLILEREIDECKQALRMFTEYVQDKDRQVGRLEDKDSRKTSRITASALGATHKVLGAVSKPQARKGRFRTSSLKKNFDSISVHSVKGAQQMELASSDEFKEEAKTKHVISIGNSSPVLNTGSRDIASGAHAMSHGTCLAMVDRQLRSSELEVENMVLKENWFDNGVRECWLGILIQISNLQNQIWSLGLSKIGSYHVSENYQGCVLNYNDDIHAHTAWESPCAPCLQDAFHMEKCRFLERFLPQCLDSGGDKLPMVLDSCLHVSGLKNVGRGVGLSCARCTDLNERHQQEKAIDMHIDPWNEILVIIDGCLVNLEERFEMFQSRLHALEVARKAMAEAANMMIKNKGKLQDILLKASNTLKDFLSLTGLGCDILDILHELVIDLTKASTLVETRCADTDLGSESNIDTGSMQGNTLTGSEEWSEKGSTSSQGDSPQSSCSTISKLAFLWSSSLEWLSNEKCRAETAFSGWDHV